MVANIAWDVYVLKEQGLTQKYQLRTYDENILAPLVCALPFCIEYFQLTSSASLTLA
jgi:hypothetical protein